MITARIIRLIIEFAFFAIFIIVQTVAFYFTKKRWISFIEVPATITKSKLHNYNSISESGYGLKRVFETEIEFSYEIDGKKYISNTPSLKPPQLFTFYDYEHDLFNSYKEGATCIAKVDNFDPNKAYLSIAPIDKVAFLLVASILIAIPIAYEATVMFLTWFDPLTGPGDWWYRPK